MSLCGKVDPSPVQSKSLEYIKQDLKTAQRIGSRLEKSRNSILRRRRMEAMAMGGDQERIDSEGSPKVLKRV